MRSREFAGRWMWLFPLTYVAHAFEEIWVGGGYAAWISALSGATLLRGTLVTIHVALIAGMCVVVGTVLKRERFLWAVVALAVIVLGNAVLHVGASLATRSYSPGLITGIVAWGPLGVFTLFAARRIPGSDLAWGMAIGTVGTVVISAMALNPALLRLP